LKPGFNDTPRVGGRQITEHDLQINTFKARNDIVNKSVLISRIAMSFVDPLAYSALAPEVRSPIICTVDLRMGHHKVRFSLFPLDTVTLKDVVNEKAVENVVQHAKERQEMQEK